MAWKTRGDRAKEKLKEAMQKTKEDNAVEVIVPRMSALDKRAEGILAHKLVSAVLSGMTRTRMVAMVQASYPGISEELIEEFLTLCIEQIKRDVAFEVKDNFDLAIARRMDLYEKAYSEMDYKTCLTIQQDIARLQGLYEVGQDKSQQETLTSLIVGMTTLGQRRLSLPQNEEEVIDIVTEDESEDEDTDTDTE